MYEIYGTETKKMINMLILDILQRYSDDEHHLTQQQILRLLKSDYGVESLDRRSVKSNVESLKKMGYEISMEEGDGYYLMSRDFEDSELRVLIDAVLSSKALSDSEAKRLIEKLKGLGNIYFDLKVSHVKVIPDMRRSAARNVLYAVDEINHAMEKRRKIAFRYKKYGTDMKMHDQGRDYIMNPYQMLSSNGRYYLLGNLEGHDDITYYRIDKMSDVEILDERIRPQKDVIGLGEKLDLPKHMAEHFYMLTGDSIDVKIKTSPDMMDTLVDWFGTGFMITKQTRDYIVARVRCNEKAIFYWALQYGPHVEILGPAKLRNSIADALHEMVEKYDR